MMLLQRTTVTVSQCQNMTLLQRGTVTLKSYNVLTLYQCHDITLIQLTHLHEFITLKQHQCMTLFQCHSNVICLLGRDMKFSLLEWCSLKYNTPKSEHRKMREKWWMWNIGAIHPIGINQFI